MFGNVVPNNPVGLDRHTDFRSIFIALVTLFRAMTGEGWNLIMRDCMIAPPFCDETLNQCGWPYGAVLYWVSFQVFAHYTMVNIVTAIVLAGFEQEVNKVRSVAAIAFSRCCSNITCVLTRLCA